MVSYLDYGGVEHLVKKILDRIQPVGSLYYSTNDTSPASLFGGTWERYAEGCVMVSASDTDSDFAFGKTGGSKTHSHLYGVTFGDYYGMTILRNISSAGDQAGVIDYNLTSGNQARPTASPPVNYAPMYTSITQNDTWALRNVSIFRSEGQTKKTNAMPPYITVYIWRRVS